MSVLGAMLLRRGDLDGAEPHLRAATAAGDRAAANNLGVLLHQRGYPEEAADGGGSPPSPGPPRPRTRSGGTTGSAATSPPPSTGCGSPPNRDTRWAPTRSPTCWSTAGTTRPRSGCGPPPSGVTGKARTGSPGRWTGGPPPRTGEDADADNGVAAGTADEAEQWYRQAAARGHRRAALYLGAILERRGELKEAGAGT